MRDKLLPFVIVAFNQATIDDDKKILLNNGFDNFKELLGCYNGEKENSYLVVATDSRSVAELLNLAYKYNQESILYVNSERESSLIYTNPETPQQFIGDWKRYDSDDVTKLEAWTLDIKEGAYYVCN